MGNWVDVAQIVNDRMQERGITQRELAEQSGVSTATLRKIQNGVNQARNRTTLDNISRALGFPSDHLWNVATRSRPAHGDSTAPTDTEDLRGELADLRRRVEVIETHLELQSADPRISE